MSRERINEPVHTYECDTCGAVAEGPLSDTQAQEEGWVVFVRPQGGDEQAFCTACDPGERQEW